MKILRAMSAAGCTLWVSVSGCTGGASVEPTVEVGRNTAAIRTAEPYVLQNVHAGRCLDVKDWRTDDGAPLQLWECNELAAQQFVFERAGESDYYLIRNMHSQKCLASRGRCGRTRRAARSVHVHRRRRPAVRCRGCR